MYLMSRMNPKKISLTAISKKYLQNFSWISISLNISTSLRPNISVLLLLLFFLLKTARLRQVVKTKLLLRNNTLTKKNLMLYENNRCQKKLFSCIIEKNVGKRQKMWQKNVCKPHSFFKIPFMFLFFLTKLSWYYTKDTQRAHCCILFVYIWIYIQMSFLV